MRALVDAYDRARTWVLACAPINATLALELAGTRAELLTSHRRLGTLERRLDHYIGQTIRARTERERSEADFLEMAVQRDHARACLAQALEDREELTGRVLWLEGELADMTRSRDELIAIADRLRAPAAAVKKGRRA